MAEKIDEHYSLPPMAFYLMLAGSMGLGAGGMGLVGPKLQEDTFRACVDNSGTALRVVAQHGQELNELRQLIYSRTEGLQSRDESRARREDLEHAQTAQNRRLDVMERSLDRLLNRMEKLDGEK